MTKMYKVMSMHHRKTADGDIVTDEPVEMYASETMSLRDAFKYREELEAYWINENGDGAPLWPDQIEEYLMSSDEGTVYTEYAVQEVQLVYVVTKTAYYPSGTVWYGVDGVYETEDEANLRKREIESYDYKALRNAVLEYNTALAVARDACEDSDLFSATYGVVEDLTPGDYADSIGIAVVTAEVSIVELSS